MMQQETLAMLREGECARVQALTQQDSMRRRLQDIGLIEGTLVACVLKSPWGDPTAYRIRGALIALRGSDAAGVLIHAREADRGEGSEWV